MRVILYMATTINGLIAKEDDNTSFVSDTEWESFRKMMRDMGNMIIGRRTYEIMRDAGEFKELEKIKIIVITDDPSFKVVASNHHISNSPKEALSTLEKEEFQKALVAGGR